MNSEQYRKDNYLITVNLNRERHKDLIEWLKLLAEEEEQSMSSLCVKLLKQSMKTAQDSKC